jgi:hypothetical protein
MRTLTLVWLFEAASIAPTMVPKLGVVPPSLNESHTSTLLALETETRITHNSINNA